MSNYLDNPKSLCNSCLKALECTKNRQFVEAVLSCSEYQNAKAPFGFAIKLDPERRMR